MFVLLKKTNIDFLSKRHLMLTLSGLIILSGFVAMIMRGGPNLSIDFKGGVAMTLRATSPSGTADIGEERVRNALASVGIVGAEVKASRSTEGEDLLIHFKEEERIHTPESLIRTALDSLFPGKWRVVADNQLVLEGLERLYGISFVAVATELSREELNSVLVHIGIDDPQIIAHKTEANQDVWILAGKGKDAISRLRSQLSSEFPGYQFEVRSIEVVGPRIGSDLRNSAIWAILASWGLMILYLWWRFELIFGVAAVVALIHNVLITLALMSLMNYEIGMTVVGAFLTIIGYSVNDTIVIFDRIRENIKRYNAKPIGEVINLSINDTLSRTIVTGGSVIVVVLMLFLYGGEVLRAFGFAMLVGILAGTYSSIFIASPLLVDYTNKTGQSLAQKMRKK